MPTHPKYKINLYNGRLTAIVMKNGDKRVHLQGLGTELVGSTIALIAIFGLVTLIFGMTAGVAVTVTLGIILYGSSAIIHSPHTPEHESWYGTPFYCQHAHSALHAWEMEKLINEALAHDDYRIDAEAIIDAGIAGFEAAVDDDGRIQVSSVLEEAAAKLQQKMQEHKNVHNTTAEDVTRNYLEGFR